MADINDLGGQGVLAGPIQQQTAPPATDTAAQNPDNGVPVFDHDTGKLVTVAREELPSILSNPRFGIDKNKPLEVMSPDGKFGTIDPSEAAKAFSEGGYRPATAQEIHARAVQKAYGDKQVQAAIAGAGRSLTLGALDYLGSLLPGGQEYLSGLKEANPRASTVGEVAGIAVPIAAEVASGVGLGAVPETIAAALRATPMGLTSKVGTAITKKVATAVESAGVKNSVAKSLVSKLAPAFVGSAVEGAAYGAGDLLSEHALGNPNANAENLLAYVGTGAILGGALGTAAHLSIDAGMAAAKTIQANAGKLTESFANPIENFTKLINPSKNALQTVDELGGKEATQQALDLVKQHNIITPTTGAEKATENASKFVEQTGNEIQDIHKNLKSQNITVTPADMFGHSAEKLRQEILPQGVDLAEQPLSRKAAEANLPKLLAQQEQHASETAALKAQIDAAPQANDVKVQKYSADIAKLDADVAAIEKKINFGEHGQTAEVRTGKGQPGTLSPELQVAINDSIVKADKATKLESEASSFADKNKAALARSKADLALQKVEKIQKMLGNASVEQVNAVNYAAELANREKLLARKAELSASKAALETGGHQLETERLKAIFDKKMAQANEIAAKIESAKNAINGNFNALAHSAEMKAAKAEYDKMLRLSKSTRNMNLEDVFTEMRSREKSIYSKRGVEYNPKERAELATVAGMREAYMQQIEKAVTAGKLPAETGQKLMQLNKDFNVAKQLHQTMLSNLRGGRHFTLGQAALWLGTAGTSSHLGTAPLAMAAVGLKHLAGSDFKRRIAALGYLEGANKGIGKLVANVAKGLSATSQVFTKSTVTAASLYSSPLAVFGGKKPKSEKEAYQNIGKNLHELSDTNKALEYSNKRTMGLNQHTPDTAAAVDAKVATALAFLAAKFPKINPSGFAQKGTDTPKDSDIQLFKRYYRAAMDPKAILHDIMMGTAGTPEIETLQQVYPEIYKNIQEQAMTGAVSAVHQPSYKHRGMLTKVVGSPADISQSPKMVQNLQKSFMQQGAAPPQPGGPGRPIKIPSSNRLGTELDRIIGGKK